MHGLVVIEGMTLLGHPWIINEILEQNRACTLENKDNPSEMISSHYVAQRY